MFIASAITGFTTGAGLLVCIGSQNAFVLKQGLLRHHLFAIAAICSISDIILICCGIAGLGTLVKNWPNLVEIVRYAGAVFLAWTALSSAKQAWYGNSQLNPSTEDSSHFKTVILTCLGFTWLNPHVYLDTVFMIGSLSIPYSGIEKWKFAAGALSASVVWFSTITYGAKLLLPLFRNPYAWRILDALVAITMGYFSVSLLITPLP
ncbi:LysE/ArgO family amino acid transporter [Vibrio gazogenes]|uniref:L-lysine exporter family protein LysE/ArgO n=1 Tax=Vibrio gazogenes DSM 21264 = NBRC 103151 TaxID=1123492 RepID=A0A1M5FFE6_VIBGA|nr:LysE/ArgO family amino acid transporter [Vibrio gazogenes]USP14413.1 LysE/ArgO family amino acid transporter [Vibrio gazogenes]SHF90215.1 L-lysine exporter family protein LysE/ArgO [Vibrio gazogenes DSM 21264] [Vibrio gazogenes DSM 21264 = NBRC 103151]SJN52878.1 Arginine exporter protein ArgO [Vibrio gazogenes]